MSPDLEIRLDTIESLLRELVSHRVIKDYYSTAEVAERVGRSEYQVRQMVPYTSDPGREAQHRTGTIQGMDGAP